MDLDNSNKAPEYAFKVFDNSGSVQIRWAHDSVCATFRRAKNIISKVTGGKGVEIVLTNRKSTLDLTNPYNSGKEHCLSIWAEDSAGNRTNKQVRFKWSTVLPPLEVELNTTRHNTKADRQDLAHYAKHFDIAYKHKQFPAIADGFIVRADLYTNPHDMPIEFSVDQDRDILVPYITENIALMQNQSGTTLKQDWLRDDWHKRHKRDQPRFNRIVNPFGESVLLNSSRLNFAYRFDMGTAASISPKRHRKDGKYDIQETKGRIPANDPFYSSPHGRGYTCEERRILDSSLTVHLFEKNEEVVARYYDFDKNKNRVYAERSPYHGYVVLKPGQSVLVKWFVKPGAQAKNMMLPKGQKPKGESCGFGYNQDGGRPSCGFHDAKNRYFAKDMACYAQLVAENAGGSCYSGKCKMDFSYLVVDRVSFGLKKSGDNQEWYYRMRPLDGRYRP